MRARGVLLDTGPLVALLSAQDARHRDAREAWDLLAPPLATCWPVLTEAAWLLRTKPAAVERMLGAAKAGLIRILPMDDADAAAISALMKRYRKLSPQLADAALVHLAHRERIETIFTFDQRDFRVFRGPGNRAFEIVP